MPSGPKGGDRPAFWRKEGWRKPEIQKKGEFLLTLRIQLIGNLAGRNEGDEVFYAPKLILKYFIFIEWKYPPLIG